MKRMIFTYLLMAMVISCSSQKKGSAHSSYSDDDRGKHSITINDENGSLELKYAGEISFTEDETALKTISPGGYLKYKKNGKKIAVTSTGNGEMLYEVNDGGKKKSLDEDEASFLAQAIKVMIENGMGAKDRVQRIYRNGGSKAVLGEVVKMKSDYVKGIYLEYLLATNALASAEMKEIANNIRTLLESDFEKGKLLSQFSAKYLADASTAQAYLNAVNSIESDFEKANAVKKILEQPLSPAQFTAVLQVANHIESDFEKANVLKKVLSSNTISAAQFSEVLKSVSSVESDFEKANILKDILKNNQLPEAQFNETLAVINSIESDFEKANLLKEVARKEITNEAQWINLISISEKVSSDFEKSNVLTDIAAKMPASDNVKAAYMKAAKTISSDFEYGKVMRAVR